MSQDSPDVNPTVLTTRTGEVTFPFIIESWRERLSKSQSGSPALKSARDETLDLANFIAIIDSKASLWRSLLALLTDTLRGLSGLDADEGREWEAIESLLPDSPADVPEVDESGLTCLIQLARSYLDFRGPAVEHVNFKLAVLLSARSISTGSIADLVESHAILSRYVDLSEHLAAEVYAQRGALYTRGVRAAFEEDIHDILEFLSRFPEMHNARLGLMDIYIEFVRVAGRQKVTGAAPFIGLDDQMEKDLRYLLDHAVDESLENPILEKLYALRIAQVTRDRDLTRIVDAMRSFDNTGFWWTPILTWVRILSSAESLAIAWEHEVQACSIGEYIADWIEAADNEDFELQEWLSREQQIDTFTLLLSALELLELHAAGRLAERGAALYASLPGRKTELLGRALEIRRRIYEDESGSDHSRRDLCWALANKAGDGDLFLIAELSQLAGVPVLASDDQDLADFIYLDQDYDDQLLAREITSLRYASEHRYSDRARAMVICQRIIESTAFALSDRLWSMRLYQSLSAGLWEAIAGHYQRFLSVVEDIGGTDRSILTLAQNLGANASFAAAVDGNVWLAIELAERGQGVLASTNSQRRGESAYLTRLTEPTKFDAWILALNDLRESLDRERREFDLPRQGEVRYYHVSENDGSEFTVERASADAKMDQASETNREAQVVSASNFSSRSDSDLEQRVRAYGGAYSSLLSSAGAVLPPVTAGALAGLAGTLNTLVIYIVSSAWGGCVLAIDSDGSLHVRDCAITDRTVQRWLGELSRDASDPEPSRYAVEGVVDEVADAMQPLFDLLDGSVATRAQIIPVGEVASLPITAVLQRDPGTHDRDISLAVSAHAHLRAWLAAYGARPALQGVALTAPEPTSGANLPPLLGSRELGDWLRREWRASHVTGSAVHKEILSRTLSAGHRFIHLGIHGDLNGSVGSRVHLADSPNGIPQHLTFVDVHGSTSDARLIFFSSCWAGRPGTTLPQEAIGFPSTMLQNGAGGVIAPLWPVRDEVACELAKVFYTLWLGGKASPRVALGNAMRTVRVRFPESASWAAFNYFGT